MQSPSPFIKVWLVQTSRLFRMILVDLTRVDPALLGRIMGKEEAEKYLATGGGA
jgi:hypothetical protein